MSGVLEGEQKLFFVRKNGRTLFAHWAELTVGDRRRTKITVFRHARALLPRSKVVLGIVQEEYDVPVDEVDRWLASRGYGVLTAQSSH